MMNLSRFLSCVGLSFLLIVGIARGQETGALRGTVKDPSGALVSESAITLQAATSQTTLKTQTDASGVFEIRNISPGAYTLQVEHAGFATLVKAVQIAPGEATNLSLAMALGMATISVEVQASREEIAETLSPGAVTVAYPDDIKGEFKSLPELLDQMPGLYVNRVSGSGQYTTVSVRGSSPTEVNIYIDGVPYNLASEAAADLSTLSIANVERVESYRGAVPARFSGAPVGGAINIVTKAPTAFTITGSAGTRTLNGRQFSLGINGPLGRGRLFNGGKLLFGADQDRSEGNFKYTNYYLQSFYDIVLPAGIPYTYGGNTYYTYAGETYCEYDAARGNPCNYSAERHRLNNSYGKDNLLLKWQNKNFVFKVDYLYMNRLMPYAVSYGVEDNPNPPASDMYYNARHQQKIHQDEALLGWNHTFFGKLTTSLNLNMMDQDKRYTNPDAVAPYSGFLGGKGEHYHTRRYGAEGDAIYSLGEHGGIDQRIELHGDWVKETLNTGLNCGLQCGFTSIGSIYMPIYTRFTTTAQLQDTLTIRSLHNLEITPMGRAERMTGPTVGWARNGSTPTQNLGWALNASIALKERFAHGWQAYSTFGKYIRYPNFYEIYGDGINIIPKTNSDGTTYAILPEIGRTLDAGVGWDGALTEKLSGHSRLTLFERWTNNNITLVQNPMQSYYTNTGDTLQHGIEFEGSLHYGQFASLQSAFTVQDGWYRHQAYYPWGQVVPITPAPGYKIPTLNAPYVTGDARLDLHFLHDKLTGFAEVKYTGQMINGIAGVLISTNPERERYEGNAGYDRPLTTLDLGVHGKIPYGGTFSGGVTDLFNQGPKQTVSGIGSGGITWQTCSESGVSVSNCPAWDLITNTVGMPIRSNVLYPQQGRTFYVTLAWQLDGLHRRRRSVLGGK